MMGLELIAWIQKLCYFINISAQVSVAQDSELFNVCVCVCVCGGGGGSTTPADGAET